MMLINFSLIIQLLALIHTGSTSELEASQVMKFQLCHDQPAKNITAPDGYVVFIEELLIGVVNNDVCDEFDSVNHCIVQAEEVQQAPCTLKENCLYRVPKAEISKCGKDKFATYIYGQYRFIPVTSQNPVIIGQAGNDVDVDVDAKPFGVVQTENYPKWTEQVDYTRKFTSINKDKAIRFYITDMDIEDSDFSDSQCKNSFLELSDGVNDAHKVCGMLLNQQKYVFTVCTNNEYTSDKFVIRYKTGPTDSFSDYYTGVRGYYEVIDKPDSLNCVPSTIPATTAASTTVKSTTVESTTIESTTVESTTVESTTVESTTVESTTVESTTVESTTVESTTVESTTVESTTVESTTVEPTTNSELTTTVSIMNLTTKSRTTSNANIHSTKPAITTRPIDTTYRPFVTLSEQILLDWGYDFNSTYINVSSSNIYKIDEFTFSNFSQLNYLDLSHNHLNERYYKLSVFYGLDKLIELRLNNNRIRNIRSHLKLPLIFEHLTSLEYLDLSNNLFKTIGSFYFKGLNNLKKLGLEGNAISSVSKDAFNHMDSLNTVCFKENPMSFYDPKVVNESICKKRSDCHVLVNQSCCELVECHIP